MGVADSIDGPSVIDPKNAQSKKTGQKGLDSFMSGGSITVPISGGPAGPSQATSNGPYAYVTMNNPFSVAGQGGKASSSAESSGAGLDKNTIILLAIIAGIVLIGLR